MNDQLKMTGLKSGVSIEDNGLSEMAYSLFLHCVKKGLDAPEIAFKQLEAEARDQHPSSTLIGKDLAEYISSVKVTFEGSKGVYANAPLFQFAHINEGASSLRLVISNFIAGILAGQIRSGAVRPAYDFRQYH